MDAAGAVSSVDPVCRQPLLTTVFTRAIERWEFDPATAGGLATPSRVLVAVLLRPPFLLNFGEPRAEPHQVPEELPAPEATPAPAYPPTALGDALVLVEVGVDASGAVSAARALGGHTGFDEAALEAARRWRFRPAQSGGAPVSSQAYIVFGFEEPVLAPLPR